MVSQKKEAQFRLHGSHTCCRFDFRGASHNDAFQIPQSFAKFEFAPPLYGYGFHFGQCFRRKSIRF